MCFAGNVTQVSKLWREAAATLSAKQDRAEDITRLCCVQAKAQESAKAKGGKEIPIPTVTFVPTYKREYLPTYRERSTYHRGRGAHGDMVSWQPGSPAVQGTASALC